MRLEGIPQKRINDPKQAEAMTRAGNEARDDMVRKGYKMDNPEDRKHIESIASINENAVEGDYEQVKLKKKKEEVFSQPKYQPTETEMRKAVLDMYPEQRKMTDARQKISKKWEALGLKGDLRFSKHHDAIWGEINGENVALGKEDIGNPNYGTSGYFYYGVIGDRTLSEKEAKLAFEGYVKKGFVRESDEEEAKRKAKTSEEVMREAEAFKQEQKTSRVSDEELNEIFSAVGLSWPPQY